jgi:transposase-like protein
LKGYSENLAENSPIHEENLHIIRNLADETQVFEWLDAYEAGKKASLAAKEESEKLFRKWRDEAIRFGLKKVKTDKSMKKAEDVLQEAVAKCVSIEAERDEILKALRTIFI